MRQNECEDKNDRPLTEQPNKSIVVQSVRSVRSMKDNLSSRILLTIPNFRKSFSFLVMSVVILFKASSYLASKMD